MVREGLYEYVWKDDDELLLKKICTQTVFHGVLYEIMKANEKRKGVRSVLVPQYIARHESQKDLLKQNEDKALRRKLEGGLDKKNLNEAKARLCISQLVKKNKCSDIFKYTVIDSEKGLRMFDDKSAKDFLRIKKSRVNKISVIHQLNIILGLKAVQKMAYVNFTLKKIELQKNLFLIDIEQGQEVFVPKDLSQNQLPLSFRYYDPLIRIIKDRIGDDILENFRMRG